MVDRVIRKIRVADAAALRDLRLQLVAENPKTYGVILATERRKKLTDYQRWIKEYRQADAGMFLLFLKGKPIGMAAVKRNNPHDPTIGYLGSLGILRAHQGRGWGKELLAYRLNWIQKNTKFKRVKMIMTKTNRRMLHLAKKFGFKIITKGSYHGVEEYRLEKILVEQKGSLRDRW
jgi:RimJ/RimL family protein N-acetyltransferase